MSLFETEKFSSTVPLRYDTVYYVECPGNDKLNHVMYQMQQDGPLFFDKNLLLFSIKLQYISQKELGNEYLRAQLGDYDADDVDDTIYYLRSCLSADNGGTLTARYMPRKGSSDKLWDVCSLSLIDITDPSEIYERAKNFARDLAETDFARLSGVSYHTYLKAKEDEYDSYSCQTLGFMTVGTSRASRDPNKILRTFLTQFEKYKNEINEQTTTEDFIGFLEDFLKKCKNKIKINTPCKMLYVEDNKIYIQIEDGIDAEVVLERNVAKTLYIFYLRRIQKAARDPQLSKSLSQPELETYKEELFEIYGNLSGKTKCKEFDIRSLWDQSAGWGFRDATAVVRKFFKDNFDVDYIKNHYGKCYTIERMGKDDKGNSRYGIDLKPDDFDLGEYSIDRMKV